MDKPTLEQDELFKLSLENFIRSKPEHGFLLTEFMQYTLQKALSRWEGMNMSAKEIYKREFPGLRLRMLIMDFIWTCPCFCKKVCNPTA